MPAAPVGMRHNVRNEPLRGSACLRSNRELRIANSEQPTANSQRPTANSQQPTANSLTEECSPPPSRRPGPPSPATPGLHHHQKLGPIGQGHGVGRAEGGGIRERRKGNRQSRAPIARVAVLASTICGNRKSGLRCPTVCLRRRPPRSSSQYHSPKTITLVAQMSADDPSSMVPSILCRPTRKRISSTREMRFVILMRAIRPIESIRGSGVPRCRSFVRVYVSATSAARFEGRHQPCEAERLPIANSLGSLTRECRPRQSPPPDTMAIRFWRPRPKRPSFQPHPSGWASVVRQQTDRRLLSRMASPTVCLTNGRRGERSTFNVQRSMFNVQCSSSGCSTSQTGRMYGMLKTVASP